ncbi:hypothetical protein RMCBS344292_02996 [Rhizopus microsporus]|nr:hypothetical protein RMCBS344292_02996 [Rhizopus microsporus]
MALSTEDTTNERTPLISQATATQRESLKRTYHVYGITLGFLFFFSFFVHWYRSTLPTPLSDVQANNADDFAGIHAYNEYLSHFTAPHSGNTRENGVMRDWIGSVALEFQKEATELGLKMDVIANDTSRDIIPSNWFTENEHWFIESRNVIVRLHGQSGRDKALLINAHYDSVPTSHGVTDNGMGVATTLELIRYFIHHPPQHTIIFLFNNLEEGGLIGAQSFIRHPWYSSVKLFVNLEGAGAGGRAVLFRCSNLNAVKKLANSKTSLVHASPAGNDMFKANLIKSDTDYSVFTKEGTPGLDIAFYAPRSHYHTPRDDLAHTTPGALQHMGQLALGAVRSIANSDDMLDTPSENQSFVYFDILGRFMFAYSLTTFQIINGLVLFLVPALGIYLSVSSKRENESFVDVMKEQTYLAAQGLAACLLAFVFSIIFIGVASFLLCYINPLMTYGDVYGAALYIFFTAFLGLQVSQLVLPAKMKHTLATTDASWHGLVAFWWIFLVVAIFAASKSVVSLYFVVFLVFFTTAAAVIQVILPQDKKFRSPVIFFTQTLVPFVFLLELEFMSMDAMRHATVDGTPEIAVYILISLPIILTIMHFVPWVYVAGNNRRATIIAAAVFLFLFTICSALDPFNGGWSPNKLVFKQEYNAGETFAMVNITTATGIPAILKQALPRHEYETINCTTSNTLTTCRYQTELVPKYASNETLNEFALYDVQKTCHDELCQVTGTYRAKNSLMCRVLFDRTLEHAWIDNMKVQHKKIGALIAYVNQYEQRVQFGYEYNKNDVKPNATFSCFYDEWTQQEIPAFTTLRDRLPEEALLLIRGQGLVISYFDKISL